MKLMDKQIKKKIYSEKVMPYKAKFSTIMAKPFIYKKNDDDEDGYLMWRIETSNGCFVLPDKTFNFLYEEV